MQAPETGREIATTRDGRDITRGWIGPLLRSTDRLLQRRGGGSLEIYEQVASDAQVQATYQQRRLAVTSREWIVEPGDARRQSKAAADWLREQLQHVGWDRVTDRMLWGSFYGYAVAELIYARDGQYVSLDAIKVRNRRRFAYDDNYQLRLLTPERMTEGELAEPPYFWHYAAGSDHDDEPYGLGLAHWLYWPVLFKREGIRFWLTFLEKFGAPTAVGKYGPNATPEERRKLLAAVEAIQTDAGVILPEGMAIELLEAARSGSVDYKSLHDTMDETIAKVVLGQTMTTENGASLSQAKVHLQVRADLVKADADLVSESFNRGPVAWLMRWNFPTAAAPQVWRVMEEPEDLAARAERDGKVFALGYRPTMAYIQQTYGEGWEASSPLVTQSLSVPDGGAGVQLGGAGSVQQTALNGAQIKSLAEIIEQVQAGSLSPQRARALIEAGFPAISQEQISQLIGNQSSSAAAFAADGGRAHAHDEYMAVLLDRVEERTGPLTDAWVAHIRRELQAAESFEDALDGLSGLLTELPLDELGEALSECFGTAQLAGQSDAQDSGRA